MSKKIFLILCLIITSETRIHTIFTALVLSGMYEDEGSCCNTCLYATAIAFLTLMHNTFTPEPSISSPKNPMTPILPSTKPIKMD